MVKKHIITCSVMLVLMLGLAAKTFIYSTHKNEQPALATAVKPVEKEDKPKDVLADKPVISKLSFASENVPMSDPNVKWRMKKMLKTHNYQHLQTNRLHQKAYRWFPVIEPILKKYGIPEDFKYVPLVESGLQSGTSSSKGASGYWQFMPQTARSFGLKVNSAIDERQNVQKSTVAACKYIRSLYREFNNWTLAAAAYNIGEISLKRQIARQGHNNYFKMKLNRETATYVYKLVSMKEIMENPKLYGYTGKASRLLARAEPKPASRKSYFSPVAERKSMMALQILHN